MDLPPNDLQAEQATLGSMLLSANALETVRQTLSSPDFFRPAHQIVFEHITEMHKQSIPVDAVTLNERLVASAQIAKVGGAPYLHTLLASVPTAANAGHYARIVRAKAVRRRLIEAGTRIAQIGREGEDEAQGATERALREVEAVRDSGLGDGLTAVTYQEFLDAGYEGDPYDWVVPNLLERGDRMILTGTPGIGKSTLFRQIAVCAAAGIHPFTYEAIPAQRVFILDCENGPAHIRRKLRPLVHQAAATQKPVPEANLWIESRMDGIDLALDKDVSWLLRQVASLNPDILAIGPLYRLAPRALNDDDDVAPILTVLNLIRARGACVLMEAHHGHTSDMRPRGSSALMGFPEFGFGLRWPREDNPGARTAEIVHWRGDRDERQWPRALIAGGRWPWSAYNVPQNQQGNGWGT
jgi:replicative DNA helicase